jgi:N-acetylneuraminate lyase
MKRIHLQGLVAAPFTPMHPDGSLHLETIPSYYAMLKANGVKGAFICGSTGEGVSMTFKEKQSVAEAWVALTRDDKDFMLMQLLGGNSLTECKELAHHAREVGVDAVSFLPPFYFMPANVDMLAECCSEVASAVPDMPFYFYHIPVLTGVGFSMYDLLRAVDRQIPNFMGIKYTHEDFMDYQSCLNFADGKYDMLWGRDENMLPALSLGAKAAVGSTFNYAAPLYYEMIEAFQRGDLKRAAQCQQTSIDMIRLLGKYGGIATGKAYMKLIGLDCGAFRLPVRNMSDTDFERFRTEVEKIGFQRFRSIPGKPEKLMDTGITA